MRSIMLTLLKKDIYNKRIKEKEGIKETSGHKKLHYRIKILITKRLLLSQYLTNSIIKYEQLKRQSSIRN